MHPIPHIAARSLKDADQLDGLVAKMVSEAAVSEVLVIGGGVDKQVGAFDSSMQVLETGILQKHNISHIGVSGHPEGSPDISDQAIADALGWKNEFAKKEGLNLYIETQFCFDAAAVLLWKADLPCWQSPADTGGNSGSSNDQNLVPFCPDFRHWAVYAVYRQTGA